MQHTFMQQQRPHTITTPSSFCLIPMQQQCLLVLALNLKRPAIVVMAEAHVFVGVVMIMAKKKKCLKNN